MKNKVVVFNEEVDAVGDLILLSGMKIPDAVPLMRDFDRNMIVGHCTVTKRGKQLVAEVDLSDEFKGLYPAIGIEVIDKEVKDGVTYVNSCKIFSVGLSATPNVDVNIKRI